MLPIEVTIIKHASNELTKLKSFAGRSEFSVLEIDELVSAFRACSTLVMLALDSESGMAAEAIYALQRIEQDCNRIFSSIDVLHSDPGLDDSWFAISGT